MAFCAAQPIFASEISPKDLNTLPPADIYLLGEVHDDKLHHKRQAIAVRALQPRALVFEMLSPEQAQLGQDIDRSDSVELSGALNWAQDGWGSFDLWYEIFAAAPDAVIYGAALPRSDLRLAVSEGAAVAFGEDAASFGLVDALPDHEQVKRESLQDEAHCSALPPDMLPGMVEAQRLRDAAFSRTALTALHDAGGPVVVITGNGHARDWGMPHALGRAAPDVTVLSIGQVTPDEIDPPYDLWLVSPAPKRVGDPCDAFKSK